MISVVYVWHEAIYLLVYKSIKYKFKKLNVDNIIIVLSVYLLYSYVSHIFAFILI